MPQTQSGQVHDWTFRPKAWPASVNPGSKSPIVADSSRNGPIDQQHEAPVPRHVATAEIDCDDLGNQIKKRGWLRITDGGFPHNVLHNERRAPAAHASFRLGERSRLTPFFYRLI